MATERSAADSSKHEAGYIKKKRALNVTPYVILGLFTIAILQAASIVFLSNQQTPPPNVYAADAKTGSITRLQAFVENRQAALAMTNFALTAVTYCMSLDFAGYRDTLDQCRSEYFSTSGFESFQKALQDDGIYNPVSNGRAILKVVADGMPTLLEPGSLGNELVYTVEVPILAERKLLNTPSKVVRQVAVVTIARDNRRGAFDLYRIVRIFIEPRQ